VNRYQKGKTNQDFTEARDSEVAVASAGQVSTSLQTDNHASRPDALPAAQTTASKQ